MKTIILTPDSKINFGKFKDKNGTVREFIEAPGSQYYRWLFWLFANTQYKADEETTELLRIRVQKDRQQMEEYNKNNPHSNCPIDYGDRRWEIGGPGSGEMSSWF